MKYTIGTRGSKLALVQAEYVCTRLAQAYPEDTFEIQVIRTRGDVVLDKPLHLIGDKGVFVKEIEEQLLEGKIQIGVHSMKDMPSVPAGGLVFAKAWKREDPRDVLILRKGKSLADLPQGAVIGTGSLRRKIQLKRLRPDLEIVNIRGNVDTRLQKMEEEQLDGIVLAAAGLHRLGLQERISCYLETEEMIPAPAQGILALEIREEDTKLSAMLDALCDEETVKEAMAERGFLQAVGGSCHVPAGAVCNREADGNYRLLAVFGNEAGTRSAYAEVKGNDPEKLAEKAAFSIRRQMAGKVFLVGGGPGDPELITVKGLQAVREADCMIYDRLSSPQLLNETKPGCELIYAGKASHDHTMKQEEIQHLLVQKSMEYEQVVRLKGGDVYVFGRGGEEGLFLQEKGVPFEVIPGISSALGGLAYAGIPVTHRGLARGFHVVTAHDKNDRLADIDFKAMAAGKETCIFLMGLGKIGEIADRLMEAGMDKQTPAAVISCATVPEQKTCVSELCQIAAQVQKARLVSPAVIVAGPVVSLRDRLNFFEQRPLSGRRYLIPKIGKESTALGRLLQKQGAAVDEIQTGEIIYKDMDFSARDLQRADWLVFTSRNGVEAFFRQMAAHRLDIRNLAGCRTAAVGAKTAACLSRYGIFADVVPENSHSDALADALARHLKKTDRVWYLGAENADRHFKEKMEKYCMFEQTAVYENRAVEVDAGLLKKDTVYDGILFTCASSVERLSGAIGDISCMGRAYSIGPKTAACLRRHGIEKVTEAERASYEGLAAAVLAEVQGVNG